VKRLRKEIKTQDGEKVLIIASVYKIKDQWLISVADSEPGIIRIFKIETEK